MKILIKSSMAAFFCFAVFTGYSQQKIEESFSGIKKIQMDIASGDCILKKSTDSEVQVKLEHSFDDKYNPSIDQKGEKLVIKGKSHRNFWKRSSNRGRSKWTLTVPDGVDISFSAGSANFEASNLKLKLALKAGSGNTTLTNITGDVKTTAGSGNLKLIDFDGSLKTRTGSGKISIESSKGDISLSCGSGKIKMDTITANISANVGSGGIDARNVDLSGNSSFTSGSGNVDVILSKALSYSIAVNSGSGDAHIDFNGNKIEGTVEMIIKKGKGKISAPFKFDTEEEIDERIKRNGIKIRKTAKLGSKNLHIKIHSGSGDASISP